MTYQERLLAIKNGLAPKTTGPKPQKPINKQSDKKKQEIIERAKTKGDAGLDFWFDYWMAHANPICSECGMIANWLLKPEYATIWRACQAHILPKKKNYGFPSLSCVIENHIVLFPSWGGLLCGCHGFYDSSWYNATTMSIWPEVVEIFKTTLYQRIAPSEIKNIPELLLKELE